MGQPYVKDLLGTTEIVLIETRQHWMAAVRFIMRPLIVLLIGIGLLILNNIFAFNDDQFFSFINDLITWIVVIIFLVSIVWIPVDLVRWDSRRYVLTNRRSMRVEGVLQKSSVDSSLEQITDIGLVETTFGRLLGYSNLSLYTASDAANEEYDQLLDGLQYKKAVLDAKEAIRVGAPLQALAPDFVVKGGTNEASMRADGKLADDGSEAEASADDGAAPPPAASPEPAPVAQPAPAAAAVEPEPAPAVTPEPAVTSEPAPEPEPEPVAAPEPVTEPALVVEPEPDAPEAAPEPETPDAPTESSTETKSS